MWLTFEGLYLVEGEDSILLLAKVTTGEKTSQSAPSNPKFKTEKEKAFKGKQETRGRKAPRQLPVSY